MRCGEGGLDIFLRRCNLISIKPFGPPAVLCTLELFPQMTKPIVLLRLRRLFAIAASCSPASWFTGTRELVREMQNGIAVNLMPPIMRLKHNCQSLFVATPPP
jgi:hypothetical protein